jgi:hypothetical protein
MASRLRLVAERPLPVSDWGGYVGDQTHRFAPIADRIFDLMEKGI